MRTQKVEDYTVGMARKKQQQKRLITVITKIKLSNLCTTSSSFPFRTLRKIRHKTRIRVRIGLKFGTLKGLIKVDLCTNFGRNPMNIHGVMTDYLRKIRSKVCHAYRVNPLEESVEN